MHILSTLLNSIFLIVCGGLCFHIAEITPYPNKVHKWETIAILLLTVGIINMANFAYVVVTYK